MKKIAIALMTLVLWMGLSVTESGAQQPAQQHMTFQNVPMDRTIVQFRINLMARGFKWWEDDSRKDPEKDIFTGEVEGVPAYVYAFYSAKNKAVYLTRVYLVVENEAQMKTKWGQVSDKMISTYRNTGLGAVNENPGKVLTHVDVWRSKNPAYADGPSELGTIDVYTYVENSNQTRYYVIIDYVDYLNNANK